MVYNHAIVITYLNYMVIIIVKVNIVSVGKFDEFVIYQIKSIMCP